MFYKVVVNNILELSHQWLVKRESKSEPMLVMSATDYQYLQLHPISKPANNNIVLSKQQLIQNFNVSNQECSITYRQHATCLQTNCAK